MGTPPDEYWTCYQCGEHLGPRFLEPAPTPDLADLDPAELAAYRERMHHRARTRPDEPGTPDDLNAIHDRIHQLHTTPPTTTRHPAP